MSRGNISEDIRQPKNRWEWFVVKYLRVLVPWLLVLALYIPAGVSADSNLTFEPESPQVFDGTSDVEMTCDASGVYYWYYFSVEGGNTLGGGFNASSGCGDPWDDNFPFAFQTYAGGPGDVHFLYVDSGEGAADSVCSSGSDTAYELCKLEEGWTNPGSIEVTYTLTGEEEEEEEETTTASSTPEEVNATTGVAALGLFSFISGLAVTLWLWTRFLG